MNILFFNISSKSLWNACVIFPKQAVKSSDLASAHSLKIRKIMIEIYVQKHLKNECREDKLIVKAIYEKLFEKLEKIWTKNRIESQLCVTYLNNQEARSLFPLFPTEKIICQEFLDFLLQNWKRAGTLCRMSCFLFFFRFRHAELD